MQARQLNAIKRWRHLLLRNDFHASSLILGLHIGPRLRLGGFYTSRVGFFLPTKQKINY